MLDDALMYTPSLEEAIDREPLTVDPDKPLDWVVEQMTLPQSGERRSTCVLVMVSGQLEGIFTTRDIVRLTAAGTDFSQLTIRDVMIHPVRSLRLDDFQDIFAALFLFRRYRIRHLPIVDDQGAVVGVISQTTLRKILRPANLLKMRRVADIMTRSVIHAPPETSVLELAQLMTENRVSCVVIVDRDEERLLPRGIVTEGDIVQFQALHQDLDAMEAKQVMSAPLFLLTPEDSLWHAHQEMKVRRVRRLVVSWNWGLGLGIVTQTSLLRVFDPMEMYSVIETLQRTVQQLETEKANRWQGESSLDSLDLSGPDA